MSRERKLEYHQIFEVMLYARKKDRATFKILKERICKPWVLYSLSDIKDIGKLLSICKNSGIHFLSSSLGIYYKRYFTQPK